MMNDTQNVLRATSARGGVGALNVSVEEPELVWGDACLAELAVVLNDEWTGAEPVCRCQGCVMRS